MIGKNIIFLAITSSVRYRSGANFVVNSGLRSVRNSILLKN